MQGKPIQLELLPGAIAEMFAQCLASGQITAADRYGLTAAILSADLDQEERQAIDRLLRSIRHGRVSPSDHISASR